MTVRLAVAGAFHTHFMKPAEDKLRWDPCLATDADLAKVGTCASLSHLPCCCLPHTLIPAHCGLSCSSAHFRTLREALASAEIVEPRIPVVSNVDAKAHSDPEAIRDILARQVSTCSICLQALPCCSTTLHAFWLLVQGLHCTISPQLYDFGPHVGPSRCLWPNSPDIAAVCS